MLKLYKRDADGRLSYHEAWVNCDELTVHWGLVGDTGQSETYLKQDEALSDDDVLREVLSEPVGRGFRPLDEGSWTFLVIEHQLDTWGDAGDLDKRHRLEERMNETLGWRGLGHCDGGSIGAGTMETCCIVADFDTAKTVIEAELRSTEFGDYSRVYSDGPIDGSE